MTSFGWSSCHTQGLPGGCTQGTGGPTVCLKCYPLPLFKHILSFKEPLKLLNSSKLNQTNPHCHLEITPFHTETLKLFYPSHQQQVTCSTRRIKNYHDYPQNTYFPQRISLFKNDSHCLSLLTFYKSNILD